jgi:carboxymethylenebutenolidase
VQKEEVIIQTKDGDCKAWVVLPDGTGTETGTETGPSPGVIVYADAFGIRPTMVQMASHVASQGYVVLLPDLFYRFGPYGPFDPKEFFKGGNSWAQLQPMRATTDNHKAAEDTAAFLEYLDQRGDVTRKVGTVGFCMGGGMALTAAAYYPERIIAAASFHGGKLSTDAPTIPHLLASKIKGEVYIAGADQDAGYPPEMARRLEDALTKAGVRHKSEIYQGKLHGWMKPDMPVYDAPAAERGWGELFALYARALRG